MCKARKYLVQLIVKQYNKQLILLDRQNKIKPKVL